MRDIQKLHCDFVQRVIQNRFPGRSDEEIASEVRLQAERLRGVYQKKIEYWHAEAEDEDIDDDLADALYPPPYESATEGYLCAYMPRGYTWIDSLARHPACEPLGQRLADARTVAVVGAGPAPELWSICKCSPKVEKIDLFDKRWDVWWPVIEEFTLPLLGQAGVCQHAAAVKKVRRSTLPTDEGYDIVVAQRVLNEGDVNLTRWCTDNLAKWGTVVLLEQSEEVLRGAIAELKKEVDIDVSKYVALRGEVSAMPYDLPPAKWRNVGVCLHR